MKKNTDIQSKFTFDTDNLKGNDLDFAARLFCLVYGVNISAEMAEKRGLNTDKSNSWIKPIALQKYVDERYEDMKFNIKKYIETGEDEVHSW